MPHNLVLIQLDFNVYPTLGISFKLTKSNNIDPENTGSQYNVLGKHKIFCHVYASCISCCILYYEPSTINIALDTLINQFHLVCWLLIYWHLMFPLLCILVSGWAVHYLPKTKAKCQHRCSVHKIIPNKFGPNVPGYVIRK